MSGAARTDRRGARTRRVLSGVQRAVSGWDQAILTAGLQWIAPREEPQLNCKQALAW
jgi:hypothetical protein